MWTPCNLTQQLFAGDLREGTYWSLHASNQGVGWALYWRACNIVSVNRT